MASDHGHTWTGEDLPATITTPNPAERYRDEGLIGRGGMSEIRRVWDERFGFFAAMKIIRSELSHHPGARNRFIAEATLTARMHHPGIVAVYEHGELADHRLWFTMTLVRGKTLKQAIADAHQHGPPSPEQLRQLVGWFLRACEAVAYAHSQQVLHRDLKPDNIMIGSFGEVFVMDWGLARSLSTDAAESVDAVLLPKGNMTMVGDIVGTPAYMPPEQARGALEQLGPPSDVYALGGVLYELLTGRPPDTGNAVSILQRRRIQTPSLFEDTAGHAIPAELEMLCRDAMEEQPELRQADAGQVCQELQSWLDGARRRAEAMKVLGNAEALLPVAKDLLQRSRQLSSAAAGILDSLPPASPISEKLPGWAHEDEAQLLAHKARLLEVEYVQRVHSALHLKHDLLEAHDRLADHYRDQLERAEESRDYSKAEALEILLRAHDTGRHTDWLEGNGAVSLRTDPAGATVDLYRVEEHHRRLITRHIRTLGTTPLREVVLPRGDYLLKLTAPGHQAVDYPVSIGRQEHWDGVRPGDSRPWPIRLPPAGVLSEAIRYVPAGWAIVGGDERANDSTPRQRIWIDGLLIQRHPVTNAQFVDFLNAQVVAGRLEEAAQWAPARPGTGAPIFLRGSDGRFYLPVSDSQRPYSPRCPVLQISWHAARAFADWHGPHRWRLPHDLEWEKAARGLDGRAFPWGNHADPTWHRMSSSDPAVQSWVSVDRYPEDTSIYGVQGLGGNARDWCLNGYRRDGETGPLLQPKTPGDDVLYRMVRGGAWTSKAPLCRAAGRFAMRPEEQHITVGFRLVASETADTPAWRAPQQGAM